MTLKISGTNIDIGQALRTRMDDVISATVAKHFDGGFSGTATMARTGRLFQADCNLHLDTGMVFEASGSAADANLAFDKAAERLEKRLRRYHRRLKDRKRATDKGLADAAAFVLEAPVEDTPIAEDFAPTIVAETRTPITTQSVAGAVMELDRTEAPVVVFRNSNHGGVNVVYRRKDGNFGWIDPALSETGKNGT